MVFNVYLLRLTVSALTVKFWTSVLKTRDERKTIYFYRFIWKFHKKYQLSTNFYI